jgi:hypothetical protein
MKLQMPSGSNFKISLGKDPELSLRGVPDHPEPLWQHHNDLMEKKIQEALKARQTHLEIFAAAFFKEVGSSEASKYQLVERWGQGKITWRFEKAL